MYKKEKLVENQFTWPICEDLLFLVLEDRVSDVFVCELVWERLFYNRETTLNNWVSSALTPSYWSEKFEKAPQINSHGQYARNYYFLFLKIRLVMFLSVNWFGKDFFILEKQL